MNKKVLIRTDASNQIGYGHLIRTLSLADGFNKHKIDVDYVLYGDNTASSIIKKRCHSVIKIYTQLDIETEKKYYQDIKEKYDIFIFDTYKLDTDFFDCLRSTGCTTMIIDDIGDRYLPVNIVLNQNAGAEKIDYKVLPNTTLLLGCEYCLLRKEFLDLKPEKPEYQVNNILLTFGGSDSVDLSSRVTSIISELYSNVDITVVIGNGYTHLENLKRVLDKYNFNIKKNVSNMWDVIQESDLIINSGGSTNYEIAYLGKPNIVIVTAKNQELLSKSLHEYGVSYNMGWYNEISDEDIRNTISEIVNDFNIRCSMYEKSIALVDGHGAIRTVEEIIDIIS